MSSASHLALFGITKEEANDFILSHVDTPQTIFEAASLLGMPTTMLSEVTGFSEELVSGYFTASGLDTTILDNGSFAGKREILSADAAAMLGDYISLNHHEGVLSNSALREKIAASSFAGDYDAYFNPDNFKGAEDGVFTPEELGFSHLGNLPATRETIESLVYGTAIRFLQAMDSEEHADLSDTLGSDPDAFDTYFLSSEVISSLTDIISDEAVEPVYTDSDIAAFIDEVITEEIFYIDIDTGFFLFEEAILF